MAGRTGFGPLLSSEVDGARKSTSRRLSRAGCVDESDDGRNSCSQVNVVVFHVEQGTPGVLEVAIRSRFADRLLVHLVAGVCRRRSSAHVRRGCTARHDRPITIQTNVSASGSAFHKFRDCLSRRLQPARTVNGDQDSQKIATSRGVRSAARVRLIVALFMKHGTDPSIERPSRFNQAWEIGFAETSSTPLAKWVRATMLGPTQTVRSFPCVASRASLSDFAVTTRCSTGCKVQTVAPVHGVVSRGTA